MLVFSPVWALTSWVSQQGGGEADPQTSSAIGWTSGGELLGAVVFHKHNGKSAWANIALAKPFPCKQLLHAVLHYSFSQLALRCLLFQVASSNIPSQTLVRRLGATLEATLREADPSGDMLIFSLRPENCLFWSRFNGKQICTPSGPQC